MTSLIRLEDDGMPPDRLMSSRNHPKLKMLYLRWWIVHLIAVTFDFVRLYDGTALRIVSAKCDGAKCI
jgi:hypothetical protein